VWSLRMRSSGVNSGGSLLHRATVRRPTNRSANLAVRCIVLQNIKAMPNILKWLTAVSLVPTLFVLGTLIPNGSVKVNGRPMANSLWWACGAGATVAVVATMMTFATLLLVQRSKWVHDGHSSSQGRWGRVATGRAFDAALALRQELLLLVSTAPNRLWLTTSPWCVWVSLSNSRYSRSRPS
jgi:hypothetical protein